MGSKDRLNGSMNQRDLDGSRDPLFRRCNSDSSMILWEEIAPKSRLSSAFSCYEEELNKAPRSLRGAFFSGTEKEKRRTLGVRLGVSASR